MAHKQRRSSRQGQHSLGRREAGREEGGTQQPSAPVALSTSPAFAGSLAHPLIHLQTLCSSSVSGSQQASRMGLNHFTLRPLPCLQHQDTATGPDHKQADRPAGRISELRPPRSLTAPTGHLLTNQPLPFLDHVRAPPVPSATQPGAHQAPMGTRSSVSCRSST